MPIQPAASTLESRAPRRRGRRVIMRWIKRTLLVVLALGIVGALVYAWLPKPVPVEVARARRQPLEVEVTEDGQTRVRDRFVVSAPITGMLQRIELDPGTRVAREEVLARIDPPRPMLLDARSRKEAAARLAAAIAHHRRATTAIARARDARDAAVREANRDRILEARDAISREARERTELAEQLAIRDLAAAESEQTAAAAEVEAARAALDESADIRDSTVVEVRSPAAGELLRITRDSAGPVTAGQPLLEIGDPTNLEIVVDVLSSDATQIRPGMPVAIEGWGGPRALAGRVTQVEPSGFTRISALGVEEQRVRVIVSLDEPSTLGDGFRVVARIITWRGDRVLAIPVSALFRDREQWAVYVVSGGRARLRPLTLGHRGRLDVEVAAGLEEGAIIVIHPSDRVADGTRVTIR